MCAPCSQPSGCRACTAETWLEASGRRERVREVHTLTTTHRKAGRKQYVFLPRSDHPNPCFSLCKAKPQVRNFPLFHNHQASRSPNHELAFLMQPQDRGLRPGPWNSALLYCPKHGDAERQVQSGRARLSPSSLAQGPSIGRA